MEDKNGTEKRKTLLISGVNTKMLGLLYEVRCASRKKLAVSVTVDT